MEKESSIKQAKYAENESDAAKKNPVDEKAFSGFSMESGNTAFVVGLHFSETCEETLNDKFKRLIKKEVDSGVI